MCQGFSHYQSVFFASFCFGQISNQQPRVKPVVKENLTLPMLRLLLSKAKDAKIFENHRYLLNPVMLVLNE